MGWKSVKEHYSIEHIVHIRDGKLCIGSTYATELISVNLQTAQLVYISELVNKGELARYVQEFKSDPDQLKRLIEVEDSFNQSILVFTYEGSRIIAKYCEELGWPNCTHDGELQYDNMFSVDQDKVVQWAKNHAQSTIRVLSGTVTELKRNLSEKETWLAQAQQDLEELNCLSSPEGT
ncbi:MAG: hypothetical protein AAGF24_03510 [Cyanobacteria bacterium P01_H01_bin.121]